MKKAVEGGSDLKRKGNKLRTDCFIADDFIDALVIALSQHPECSYEALARESGISSKTIRKAVQSLGLRSYARFVRQMLTTAMMANRVLRSQKLLSWLQHRRM